jgi:CRISPR-associated protein Csb2
MSADFCLTIRLLDHTFHGRRDRGESEWPPSPARAFQAIVAATAARAREKALSDAVRHALQWLERQPAPRIVAPVATRAEIAYCASVPNNAMDVAARYWVQGNYHSDDAKPATHRTMKTISCTYLRGGAVHYLWRLPDPLDNEIQRNVAALSEIAVSVVALGWGIDIAIGHGSIISEDKIASLPGEHWFPVAEGGGAANLRGPIAGTFDALIERHQRFLARLGPDGFAPPPPLTAYQIVAYRRASDPAPRPAVAFVLLDPETNAMRPFDPTRHTLTIAYMMRHAVKLAAQHRWSEHEIARTVMGHAEPRNGDHVPPGNDRFAFLPLPTIEFRGPGKPAVVGSIRRAMLSSFSADFREPIAWARLAIPGQELVMPHLNDASAPAAILSAPRHDAVVRRYVEPAATWATVTPIVLPGYDDPDHYRRRLQRGANAARQKEFLNKLDSRIDGLIRKSIRQADFPAALAERALIDWRSSGFWAGTDLAGRYAVPDYLKRFTRIHVRIIWRNQSGRPLKVPGPICLGGGRFFGLGLFAGVNDGDA